MKIRRVCGWVWAVLLAVLFLSSSASAQTTALSGTVTDPAGASVPDAEVILTNEATRAVRRVTTASNGGYIFPQLAPGKYKIEVKVQGFKTAVREHLEVAIAITTTFDVRLTLGTLAETVVVEAQAAAINVSDATVGNVISGREIANLPILNLDPAALLSLQPGVTFVPGAPEVPGGYGGATDFDGRGGSVNGSRSDQSNVTLDGIDVNDPQKGYAFQSVLRSTQASLQEFRVTTSNSNAEAGRSSAAQVQLVTKSGTNDLHGVAYWAHRNEAFNANDFFLNRDGVEKGKFRRHIYGLALGGPVIKDRFFLFGNWEELRENLSQPTLRSVPSLSFRDGVFIYECQVLPGFAACPATTTSVAGLSGTMYTVPAGHYGLSPAELAAIDPLGLGVNAAIVTHNANFPTPNAPGTFDQLNIVGFNFAAPATNFLRTWVARADLNIDRRANHTLFWRGTMHDDNLTFAQPQFPGLPPNQAGINNNKGFALGYRAVLSPKLVNTFSYGLTRIGEQIAGRQQGQFVDFRFISNLEDYDSNSLGRIIPQHHFRDDTSWTLGSHTLSFGGEMRFTRNSKFTNASSFHTFIINPSWLPDGGRSVQPGQPGCSRPGCFAVPAVSDAGGSAFRDGIPQLLGPISQVDAFYNFDRTGATQPAADPVRRRFAVNEYELYVQNQWRATSTLTLTAGVRYFISSPPWEANGNQVAPTSSLGAWFERRRSLMLAGLPTADAGLINVDLAGPANDRDGYYDWDFNNLSPRVAAAWAPHFREGILGKIFGDGKMSIRGGYSLVYDRIGSALATTFDEVGSFGLSTNITSFFGGCNIGPGPGTRPACVRFSGVSNTAAAAAQSLQPSPGGGFPTTPPTGLLTVTSGLDDTITTPYSHTMSFAVSRELPWDLTVEAAYVGRRGRNLLLIRDFGMPADLVDPGSGVSAFAAARQLIAFGEQNVNAPFQGLLTMQPIPFWQNLFPSFGPAGVNGGCLQFDIFGVVAAGNAACGYSATQVAYDYMIGYHGTPATGSGFGTSTFWQDVDYFGFPGFMFCAGRPDLDGDGLGDCPNAFFTEQYVNLHTWSSIARSEYHGLQIVVRKRMRQGVTFNLNYTLSKSLDHSSTPERQEIIGGFFAGGYSGTTINAWDINKEYSFSDFDMRHQFNANWTVELPFGRGRRFASNISTGMDHIFGGWMTSGIVRINSALPAGVVNGRSWPTNWDLQGNATCSARGAYRFGLSRGPCPGTQNVKAATHGGLAATSPNLFADPDAAFDQFRFTETGERGGRNNLRADNYFSLDFALAKQFKMPWEGHKLTFRWEVFNLTNSVYFDATSLNTDIETRGTFGDYTAVMGGPRRMQFSLRYEL